MVLETLCDAAIESDDGLMRIDRFPELVQQQAAPIAHNSAR
eukprot:CAMPEP_0119138478 /NCGR_PEP_ID=MMETSP1310-20130426/25727_1 /TAXON_ID=464262 /ORGANISM="Genus nov. species nov., Strain RCC2339" /LENGTH=40 /DNA_ID= /DNA_START= /DNA_END= /DNA_ORIENTATION=